MSEDIDANEGYSFSLPHASHHSVWNHGVCERCWFSLAVGGLAIDGADLLYRIPVQVVVERRITACCFCGLPKTTEIYVRRDPKDPVLDCGGQHRPDPDHPDE